MPDFERDLHVCVNETEIAMGCHIQLDAREEMTLRPALQKLEILELSESSKAILSGRGLIEVQSSGSVLSRGEIINVFSRREKGKNITTIIFSAGYSLWQSSVSLSISAGVKVSDTMRNLLSASGTGVLLSAFAADDRLMTRPQVFFGRTCDALMTLARSLEADIFVDSSGVCVSSASFAAVPALIAESEILSFYPVDGKSIILITSMLGWPLGNWIQTEWKGNPYTGRIISRLIRADNVSGPWKAELEIVTEE